MTISVKTYVPGEVLFSTDLNAHLTTIIDEVNRLAALPHNANLFGRNLLNNGDFSVVQRGTSQTTSGYGSDDRWKNENTGSTKVASQQPFIVGQTDVTDNSNFFSLTIVTTSAGAANFVSKSQRIEGVQKTSGEAVTLQFWAKATTTKNVSLEFIQHFGTGGSPSSDVTGTGITTIALTSSWVKHTLTVTIPSITGKTLGTDGNDFLEFRIWMDAGTDFNARTNSLGQQSGQFSFANMQLELGSSATDFEYVQPADQLARCKRYLINASNDTTTNFLGVGYKQTTDTIRFGVTTPVTLRATPTITAPGTIEALGGTTISLSGLSVINTNKSSVLLQATATGIASDSYVIISNNNFFMDAEL